MTENKLSEAMKAVSAGESPFTGDGAADFNVEAAGDVPIEPSVAPRDRFKRGDFVKATIGLASEDGSAAKAKPVLLGVEKVDALEAELAAGVDQVIASREKTHGSYANTARVAQTLKRILRAETANYETLTFRQRESLDHICTKLARIVSGDASEPDHWLDIQGYAKIAID